MNERQITEIVNNMSVEKLCGQVLAYDVQSKDDPLETERIIRRIKPGALYLRYGTDDPEKQHSEIAQNLRYARIATEASGVPTLITNDVENGPGSFSPLYEELPHPMAWGASKDEEAVERAGELTAKVCRGIGIHFGLAPVVDLNYNFQNPIVNIRAISDDPDRVIALAGAYVRGMQKNGYMTACVKHFPGDGVDDRNQHFVTTVNSLDKETWMKTYGKIYKEMFKLGVGSVMVGHIALPAFDDEGDKYGPLPATLSKNLITGLLKNELGFKGCVISDAMSMIGTCARVPLEDLAVSFLNAGGDMVLFPEPEDYDRILSAVQSGKLPLERLKDAVTRCLRLKSSLRLDDEENVQKEIGDVRLYAKELKDLAQKIADESIKVVRNDESVLPVSLKKGAKVLLLDMHEPHFQAKPTGKELETVEKEFLARGYKVKRIYNAKHKLVKEIMNDYDLVVVNCKISCLDYSGASMRVGWNNIMTFWRGYVLQHPKLVFVSFGDPYKLYDFPYLKTYINAFSYSKASQKAAVKLILGEIEEKAKNPVRFEGFFERED